jgi:Transcriptional regulators
MLKLVFTNAQSSCKPRRKTGIIRAKMKNDLTPILSTMRDIAKAAGVHHSTVSRAMRDDPRVKPETREAIKALARRMQYAPNPYVTALATQMRSHSVKQHRATIGVLDTCSLWTEEYEEGIRARAAEHGFAVDTIRLRELGGGMGEAGKIITARGIRGMIALPVQSQPDFAGLDFRALASATIDLSLRSPALHRACADYFQGIYLAADTLHAKGYKRIGFCTHASEIHRIGVRWLGGYLAWREQRDAAASVAPHISPFLAARDIAPDELAKLWRESHDAFCRWLDREKPDAIISNIFYFADWLKDLGCRIPDDIGFAALGITPGAAELSGICQRGRQIGAAAVDLVAGQIYRNEYGLPSIPTTVLVPSIWIDGATTF